MGLGVSGGTASDVHVPAMCVYHDCRLVTHYYAEWVLAEGRVFVDAQ